VISVDSTAYANPLEMSTPSGGASIAYPRAFEISTCGGSVVLVVEDELDVEDVVLDEVVVDCVVAPKAVVLVVLDELDVVLLVVVVVVAGPGADAPFSPTENQS